MTTCQLCQESMEPWSMGNVPQFGHRECMLRNVMGGIGHLTDHDYWCTQMHDPDGGKSFRESALLVDQWVVDNGMPKW